MASHVFCEAEALAGEDAANEPLDEAQRRLALQVFLCANYDGLRRQLTRHLGCADMASECLHDAWLRLGHLEVRAPVQNPNAYVYRVACNVAMDRLRGERAWRYVDDPHTAVDAAIDHAPGPEDIAEVRAEVDSVHRAMQGLSGRHRAVLEALRIDEKTRQEVAAHYGLSLRKVDTVLRQALDHCGAVTGRPVLAGVSAPRKALGGPANRPHPGRISVTFAPCTDAPASSPTLVITKATTGCRKVFESMAPLAP